MRHIEFDPASKLLPKRGALAIEDSFYGRFLIFAPQVELIFSITPTFTSENVCCQCGYVEIQHFKHF